MEGSGVRFVRLADNKLALVNDKYHLDKVKKLSGNSCHWDVLFYGALEGVANFQVVTVA